MRPCSKRRKLIDQEDEDLDMLLVLWRSLVHERQICAATGAALASNVLAQRYSCRYVCHASFRLAMIGCAPDRHSIAGHWKTTNDQKCQDLQRNLLTG